ncbi:putative rod shape-determining protein MreC [unidentified eubacterium SCB49]|nr:putative rod shape-determining protein MreC [unidentified eubacterium SCB49]
MFLIAISFTIQANSYHTSSFVNSANFLGGGIYSARASVTDYFGLDAENQKLTEENTYLRRQIEQLKLISEVKLDTTITDAPFYFKAAKVINNNYTYSKNNITINKGAKDSIAIDQGVITSQGLVGIVNNTSINYATIQSILNTNSEINAKLKKDNHFGTLVWNTKNPNIVQLKQIPRLAPLVAGDTIVTGGKSTIFPEGILIGTIKDFELTADDSYIVNVQLFNDMTNLKQVYLIKPTQAIEILQLEAETEDAEQ